MNLISSSILLNIGKVIVLALFSWGLGAKLLAKISLHALCLTGRRNEKEDRLEYRFDVQNNEDVALNGQRSIRFNIQGAGAFLSSPSPEYHVGCNAVRPTLSDDGKTLELHFNEMPPHDCWTITFETDLRARDIQLEIVNEGGAPAGASEQDPNVSHSRLKLPAHKLSVFVGRRKTPEGGWAWLTIFSVLILYGLAYGFFVSDPSPWDFGGPLIVAAGGTLLWWFSRRQAPSVSQAYWIGKPIAKTSDSSIASVN